MRESLLRVYIDYLGMVQYICPERLKKIKTINSSHQLNSLMRVIELRPYTCVLVLNY